MPYIDPSVPISDVAVCPKCQIEKSVTDFYYDRQRRINKKDGSEKPRGKRNGRSSWCKKCVEQWRSAHPRRSRNKFLQCIYGITLEQFEEMVANQNNRCAICSESPDLNAKTSRHRKLWIDHCHKTGYIRELICYKCNTALGNFRDNAEYMRCAIAYIEKHNHAFSSQPPQNSNWVRVRQRTSSQSTPLVRRLSTTE